MVMNTRLWDSQHMVNQNILIRLKIICLRMIKNLIKLNLNFFNHHKKNYRYIADENFLIDQIFNEKLNNLFLKEMSNNNKKEEFLKDFACSVQKVYEFYFNKIIQYTVNLNFF